MTTAHTFIEPLDVLFLRGNRLFGDPGSFGESHVLPWPSVAAGAIRSLMLAQAGIDPASFARGEAAHPALGTPGEPGPFRLAALHLARRSGGRVETLHAPPADLFVTRDAAGSVIATRLAPVPPAPGLLSSAPLSLWPVLPQAERGKPATGWWLTQAGWQAYLAGSTPAEAQLVKSSALWDFDTRVGIGLAPDTGRADDGKLFGMQALAFRQGVGFVAGILGSDPPAAGMLRFGGDGRGASISRADVAPTEPDPAALVAAGRCRIVLTSPGVFERGWLPAGTGADHRFELHGVRARLVCAAVPRAEIASGFDLARQAPKPAQRVAPTGSVYWLDDLEAAPAQLRKLAEAGLWDEPAHNPSRRVEGFNRFAFAAW